MTSRRINTIFFDAAGTLFTVNGSVGDIYARIAREHGKDVAIADLEAGFRRGYASAPPMAFPGASPEQVLVLEKQWWRTLVQNVFASLGPFPNFDNYFDALFKFFAQATAWKLYPDTLPTLEQLKQRSLRLGVISNFDSRLFGLLDGLGLTRFFDPIVISTQVGTAKPEPAIFAHALAHTGTPAETALHVGDSHDADVIGAQNAGLTPVFLDRSRKTQKTESHYAIASLADLLAIVDV